MAVTISRGPSSEAMQALAPALARASAPPQRQQQRPPTPGVALTDTGVRSRPAMQMAQRGGFQEQFAQEQQIGRLRARQAAEKWEFIYTTQQRHRIARLNQARVDIGKNMNFSLEEKKAAIRLLDLEEAGIEPSMMPKKNNFPDDQQPGMIFEIPGKGTFSRKEDGSLQPITAPKDMPEELERSRQHALELANQKRNQAQRDARTAAEVDWSSETYIDEKQVKKLLSPEQVQERSRRYFPGLWEEDLQAKIQEFREYQSRIDEQKAAEDGRRQAEIDSRLEQEQQSQEPQAVAPGQPQPQGPSGEPAQDAEAKKQFDQLSKGIAITKAESGMPNRVAMAQAFLREVSSSRSSVPEYKMLAVEEARRILREHLNKGR